MEKPNGYISLEKFIEQFGSLTEEHAKNVYIDVSLMFNRHYKVEQLMDSSRYDGVQMIIVLMVD